MTFIPLPLDPTGSNVLTQPGDSASNDAFSRIRISEPIPLFNTQHQYKVLDIDWDSEVTGAGTLTHNANESTAQLNVTTASGDEVIYQSLEVLRYQPGKSMQVFLTFSFPTQDANRSVKVGQFDDDNGIFLEDSGSAIQFVRRTKTSGAVVNNPVVQASWNIDPFDGTGPSGITLDLTKTQILVLDYQWLGVGRVRVGFDIDGIVYYAHQFLHANILTVPYTQTMNLPVRGQITNTGVASGSAILKIICASVAAEGGVRLDFGSEFSQDTGTTGATAASGVDTPIISIRPRLTFNSISTKQFIYALTNADVLDDGNQSILVKVIYDGSLTGASFGDVNTNNSGMEFDTSATAISGGIQIGSFYLPSTNQAKSSATNTFIGRYPITTRLDGTQIPITLTAAGLGGASNAIYASLDWIEIR